MTSIPPTYPWDLPHQAAGHHEKVGLVSKINELFCVKKHQNLRWLQLLNKIRGQKRGLKQKQTIEVLLKVSIIVQQSNGKAFGQAAGSPGRAN